MNKFKGMPRCPYCGTEMKRQWDDAGYWYVCSNTECKCFSPRRRTKEEAYKAAVKRWKEPNRVLTIEELKAYNGFMWCESTYENTLLPGYIENRKLHMDGDIDEIDEEEFDLYGIVWRCWLRKPSEEERESVCWEKKK